MTASVAGSNATIGAGQPARAANGKAGRAVRLLPLLLIAALAFPAPAQNPKSKKNREAAMTKLRDDLATVMATAPFKDSEKKKLEKVREALRRQVEDLSYGKKMNTGKV